MIIHVMQFSALFQNYEDESKFDESLKCKIIIACGHYCQYYVKWQLGKKKVISSGNGYGVYRYPKLGYPFIRRVMCQLSDDVAINLIIAALLIVKNCRRLMLKYSVVRVRIIW